MKKGIKVKLSSHGIAKLLKECGRLGEHVGPFDSELGCMNCSYDHVKEFENCIGVVEGKMFDDPSFDEVDVRWQPSNLKYGYSPEDLVVIKE